MSRVLWNDFAPESSFGFGEGKAEVVGAEIIAEHLSPNKVTGETYEPRCALRLLLQRLDNNWNKTEEEPKEETWGIGSLKKFHPGSADDADDTENVEDMGAEADAVGNTTYSVDGSKIHPNSKVFHLLTSLQALGFRPEILGRGFAPDLVGLKGTLYNKMLEKRADWKGKNDPSVLVFKDIKQFPYEKPASKAAGKGANAAPAPPAKTAKPAAKAPAAESNGAGNVEVAEVLAEEIAAYGAGKKGGSALLANMRVALRTRMQPKHGKEVTDAALKLLADADQLRGMLEDLGGSLGDDGVTVNFA